MENKGQIDIAILATTLQELTKSIADHESRLRKLEYFAFAIIGAGFLWKFFFG